MIASSSHSACGDLPSSSDLVEDVLERWPSTLSVFLRHRMACPGCPMARFQTVAEVADDYGLDTAALLNEFALAIAGKG
ncbi:DUF1858 domain-containing protein [Roseomonas genomospecies 6]|uniref:DUF1858 domain-containing protein n=1 Tax=Roseomonas genomospecies 6 TaxID=214106 RepID=A0A9W7TZ14_9PROT|nr:DUF1858 domain-containing protein [Roseomonas genomospecies 6]KAA0680692.1 DUF1858 domain-containing protein [Roseomonas genomospecies 6]